MHNLQENSKPIGSARQAPPAASFQIYRNEVTIPSQQTVLGEGAFSRFNDLLGQNATSTKGLSDLPDYSNSSEPTLSESISEESTVFIGVVGVTGSGKSSFINRVTGCEEVLVANGLRSGTRNVNQASLQIGSTTVSLVDTPGFNDTELTDDDVCYMLIDWLRDFHDKNQKLNGLLYLHPINKTREKGSDVRSLKIFKRLAGSNNFENVVIGITFYDMVDPNVADSRERTLRETSDFWADMIAAGATIARIPLDKDGCISLLAKMAGGGKITLQAEKELFEENKPISELSVTQEMQHYHELKLIRMKEEMEKTAQQMLFDERVRLTTEFSMQRAALQQHLFEERQTKQLLEEENLRYKDAYEKEKEDMRLLKLEHDRDTNLRKQEIEQEKRMKKAKEDEEENMKLIEKLKRMDDLEYAENQAKKVADYINSKASILNKCIDMFDGSRMQGAGRIKTSLGLGTIRGGLCAMCWSIIRWNRLPFQYYKPKSDAIKHGFSVCTSEKCLSKARTYYEEKSWQVRWDFALMDEPIECRLISNISKQVVCSRCWQSGKPITGFYWHCCKCDDDGFNLCLECWAVKGLGCRQRYDHDLHKCFFYEESFKFKMTPDEISQ